MNHQYTFSVMYLVIAFLATVVFIVALYIDNKTYDDYLRYLTKKNKIPKGKGKEIVTFKRSENYPFE